MRPNLEDNETMGEPRKRTFMKADRTPEELAELRAECERFTRERPTLEELLASGEYEGPFEHGAYLDILQALSALKAERLRKGLTLTEVAERSGIDKAAISRLENGLLANPTISTLSRYAEAIGRRVAFSFPELEPAHSLKDCRPPFEEDALRLRGRPDGAQRKE